MNQVKLNPARPLEVLPSTTPTANPATRLPRDLFNFCRRVLKLERGRVYHLVLMVPEQPTAPITWAFLGDGKEEGK